MRKSLYVGGGILAAAAVGGTAWFVTQQPVEVSTIPTREPVYVPDFSFPDEAGKPVVLSDVDASVRVVNFWASWSPYSTDELRALVALKELYGDRIAVVALNRDTNREDGKAFHDSLVLGDALVFAYDTQDTYYRKVGGYNMPETIFVGQDEEVLAHIRGPMQYDEMVAVVEKLLAEEE